MDIKKIRIDDFDYPLPEERIALHPLEKRDSCKLLLANASGKMTHSVFSRLPLFVEPDTLIIANETKVIRARLEFVKDTGARIEIFLLEPATPHDYVTSFAATEGCSWHCLVGNRKRWKEGTLSKRIEVGGKDVELSAAMVAEGEVRFDWSEPDCSFAEVLEAAGNIPIPPYLKRDSEESDTEDYQTVYSKTEGSVAAPTAGLHFTPELIDELRVSGNEFATVTLHVGAGTFQPVKSEEIGDHPMHSEWISVSRHTLFRLIGALENGRDILAVGTTSVRTLESLPYIGEQIRAGEKGPRVTQWMPYEARYARIDTIRSLRAITDYLRQNGLEALETTTSIMIAPGFRWRIVNRLITNFHQPKSTLLLLVSSFLGKERDGSERWLRLYEEALANGYRFLSYGDACLFSRGSQPVELPESKSMVLRAATIYACFCPEKLQDLDSLILCDDAEQYISALKQTIKSAEGSSEPVDIHISEGATPLRFLIAFAASLPGSWIKVTCGERLRNRPLAPLISTLKDLGAEIECEDTQENWEVTIRGKKLKGGKIEIETTSTSQYLSALMLASLLWESPLEVPDLNAGTVSAPYIRMTREMMRAYATERSGIRIEADWSATAFFLEYCLLTGREMLIEGLTKPDKSLQGDSVAARIFAAFGVEISFESVEGHENARVYLNSESLEARKSEGMWECDFREWPDLVPAVAVALCYRQIPFRLTGIGHLRHKESDRLMALESLLNKTGYGVSAGKDWLEFDGEFRPLNEFPITVEPYGDHRIAMAFYPLELLRMVNIEDKWVVSKSYPNFYQQF